MTHAVFAGLAGCLALALSGHAQVPNVNGTPVDAVAPRSVAPPTLVQLPLSALGSPGTENWEVVPSDEIARNTTQPAHYLAPSKGEVRNGTAIILAPRGGFMVQSIGNEGLGARGAVLAWSRRTTVKPRSRIT